MFFLSYTRSNSAFALKLAKDLKKNGISLWIDQLDIPTGKRWDAEVENALKTAEGVIVILTPESVKSNNVQDEISYAIEENKKLIPVMAEHCQLPFRLRRFQYVDLSKDYDTGLADLLQDFNTVTENNSGVVQKIITKPDLPVEKEVYPAKSGTILKNKFLLGWAAVAILLIIGYFIFFKNPGKKTELQAINTTTKDTSTKQLQVDTTKTLPFIDTTAKPNKTKKEPEKESGGNSGGMKGGGEETTPVAPTGKDYYQEGENYLRKNDCENAVKSFTNAIRAGYNETDVYKNRASCYEQLKQTNEAISDYEKLLAQSPSDLAVRYKVANLNFSIANYDESIKQLNYLISSKTSGVEKIYSQALLLRANCYHKKSMTDLACIDYNKAREAGVVENIPLFQKLCFISAETNIKNVNVAYSVNSSVKKGSATQYKYWLTGEKKYLDNIKKAIYYFPTKTVLSVTIKGYSQSSTQRRTNFQVDSFQIAKFGAIKLVITTINNQESTMEIKYPSLSNPSITVRDHRTSKL